MSIDHKHDVEPKREEFIQCEFICIKYENRQDQPMMLEIGIVVFLWVEGQWMKQAWENFLGVLSLWKFFGLYLFLYISICILQCDFIYIYYKSIKSLKKKN